MEFSPIGTSSNGKTAASGSAYRGSNPCVPAKSIQHFSRNVREEWSVRTRGNKAGVLVDCEIMVLADHVATRHTVSLCRPSGD